MCPFNTIPDLLQIDIHIVRISTLLLDIATAQSQTSFNLLPAYGHRSCVNCDEIIRIHLIIAINSRVKRVYDIGAPTICFFPSSLVSRNAQYSIAFYKHVATI